MGDLAKWLMEQGIDSVSLNPTLSSRPICFWVRSEDLLGKLGVVFGWASYHYFCVFFGSNANEKVPFGRKQLSCLGAALVQSHAVPALSSARGFFRPISTISSVFARASSVTRARGTSSGSGDMLTCCGAARRATRVGSSARV